MCFSDRAIADVQDPLFRIAQNQGFGRMTLFLPE